MLNADSVFERLLREAANLVPKMSTPRLTSALNSTSHLQQKITETLASRLQQEKDGVRMDFNNLSSSRLEPHTLSSCISSMLPMQEVPTNSSRADGVSQSDFHADNTGNSQANIVGLEYSDNTMLAKTTPETELYKKESTINLQDTNLASFPPQSTTSTSSIVSVLSTADSSPHTTVFLPAITSVGDRSTVSHSSASSSELHGSVLSTQIPLDQSSSAENCAVTFVSALFPEKGSCTNQATQNGQVTETLSSPVANTASSNVTDAAEMKTEPLEQLSNPANPQSTLSALAFTTVPTLTSSTPHPLSTSSLSTACLPNTNPVVYVENTCQPPLEATNSHSKLAHGNGPYRCRDCDKEFRILRYLEKHRRIHTGEKPYQCCYCGRQFNDWPNMNRHKRIHTGERPYRCSVCAKTFSQPAVYNEHVKRHTGERPYICMVCAKGFPRAARLAVHMRVHTGERPYPCTSCDRRFSQPHHLAAHLRIHSGDRPYSCPKCDVSFACISNLRRHRKQVHASSPLAGDETDLDSSMEKKPGLQRLSTVLPAIETTVTGSGVKTEPSMTATSTAFGNDSPVALAAAMSGTLLTAAGALVPAGLLSASSIPGLFLTSGPSGTLIATSNPFSDQQQHLQPTLLAPGVNDATGQTLLSGGGPTTIPISVAQSASSNVSNSDSLLKSIPSSGVSLVLPSMLSGSNAQDNLRQATVTFFTPTGELERSNLGNATLTTGAHDGGGGGFILNSSSGEAVYLEPLDPRMALDPNHQFTFATIPTSLAQGATTILGPGGSGAHLLGNPIQLQTGSHMAHIAFATNLSGTPQIIAPNSSVLPAQASVYATSQGGSPAIFLASPTGNATLSTQTPGDMSSESSVDQSIARGGIVTSGIQHTRANNEVHMSGSTSGDGSSQSAILVPVGGNSTRNLGSSASSVTGPDTCSIYSTSWPTGFTPSSIAQSSPDTVTFEERADSVIFINSRPSSTISVTTTSANETNL